MHNSDKCLPILGISESIDYIYHLAMERFSGTLEIAFEMGNMFHIEIRQTMEQRPMALLDRVEDDDVIH